MTFQKVISVSHDTTEYATRGDIDWIEIQDRTGTWWRIIARGDRSGFGVELVNPLQDVAATPRASGGLNISRLDPHVNKEDE